MPPGRAKIKMAGEEESNRRIAATREPATALLEDRFLHYARKSLLLQMKDAFAGNIDRKRPDAGARTALVCGRRYDLGAGFRPGARGGT